ncbi:hypothetical protein D9619_009907 [Psilocybe cf. subviscida]|uniref:Cytochrome P450 n=1 Tax=Psilocybe cf. subviscida TaxID=2480587 RepID=A0A8H5F6D3_9AGAR|nr:hypothetical protein D9619_009907 [Psilocybe cf. subviscida]
MTINLSAINLLEAFLSIVAIAILRQWIKSMRNPPGLLPPGPRGLPLLENILDMPQQKEWETFTEWARRFGELRDLHRPQARLLRLDQDAIPRTGVLIEFSNGIGDIVSVSIMGRRIVVVNSAKIASEMLDRKSAVYSDRPVMQMAGELVGWRDALPCLPYDHRFRNQRKMIHQVIGTHAAVSSFHPMLEAETRGFLKKAMEKPSDLLGHIRKTTGAVVLRLTYGYEVSETDDPLVKLADTTMDQFSKSVSPGGFLVNLVPALRLIPEWLPGGGFKKIAREWRKNLLMMTEKPYQFVKDSMKEGDSGVSYVTQHLASLQKGKTSEDDIKWSAMSLYAGGADTTVAAIYVFFLAMVLHPECARLAQKEIDEVVGRERLPTIEDMQKLPYVHAMALEVQRWHSLAPMGLPHRVMEDDVHDGYFIPKGSLVIANLFFIAHDERVYPDPFSFKPERFMGSNPEPDPRNIYYGFGRRICPGRLLADASVFITIAMSLAVSNIEKVTQDGKDVEVTYEQMAGSISHCKPFECSVKPRSKKAESLVLQAAEQ